VWVANTGRTREALAPECANELAVRADRVLRLRAGLQLQFRFLVAAAAVDSNKGAASTARSRKTRRLRAARFVKGFRPMFLVNRLTALFSILILALSKRDLRRGLNFAPGRALILDAWSGPDLWCGERRRMLPCERLKI